jgi:hypothetical protein
VVRQSLGCLGGQTLGYGAPTRWHCTKHAGHTGECDLEPNSVDLASLVLGADGLIRPICATCHEEVAVRWIANHYHRHHPDMEMGSIE